MIKQRFEYVTNEELQEFNEQGWYVVQVIETNNNRLSCEALRCLVLLERNS